MKKFVNILWKVIVISILVVSINTLIELIRIKNSLTNKPIIVLTERASANNYYYYSIGFSEEYIYKNNKLIEVKFRLFNRYVIWSKKNEV